MESLYIALDFDGSLARTQRMFTELINYRRAAPPGAGLREEDITSWSWWQQNGYHGDFKAMLDVVDRLGLRASCPAYDIHVADAVRTLQRQGHHVEVLTCNKPESADDISAWLAARNIEMPVRCIGRGDPRRKLDQPFDVWVDDATPLIEAAEQRGKPLLAVQQPYNRHIPDGRYVRRLSSFSNLPFAVTSLVAECKQDIQQG